MLTLWLVINTGVCADTVVCKELEVVLTLWLVINIGVCVDTVASKKFWCWCRHCGL